MSPLLYSRIAAVTDFQIQCLAFIIFRFSDRFKMFEPRNAIFALVHMPTMTNRMSTGRLECQIVNVLLHFS